jgi:hypothetical protein
MVAIERDNVRLKGVLPKDYARPGLVATMPTQATTCRHAALPSSNAMHRITVDMAGGRTAQAAFRWNAQRQAAGCAVMHMLSPA